MHARNGCISTSGLKSDVTTVFLDPRFPLGRGNFAGSVINKGYNYCVFFIAHARNGFISTSGLNLTLASCSSTPIPSRCGNFGDSAKNEGYIAYFHCACVKRPYFHFRSKIWRHHRVPLSRFPTKRENFDNSRTVKADIGLHNICMGLQDLLA